MIPLARLSRGAWSMRLCSSATSRPPALPPGQTLPRVVKASRCRRRGTPTRCMFGGFSDPSSKPAMYRDPEETWLQYQSVEKSLRVAVEMENYQLAARLRDEQAMLAESFTVTQRYIVDLIKKLRDGSEGRVEVLEAICDLGEVGQGYDAIPALADAMSCAHAEGDEEMMDAASEAMWTIFMRSNNPKVSTLMETGTRFLQVGDLKGALGVFTEMIRIEPSFAEGYNKRATVLFLMQEYAESIEDCLRVLDLEPFHFGALSGMGLCHLRMEDPQGALHAFERTLKVHPGLEEIRRMAKELHIQLGGER